MLALFGLLCLSPFVSYWLPTPPSTALDTSQAQQLIARIQLRKKQYPDRFADNTPDTDFGGFRNSDAPATRLFEFDPNQASEAELVTLGFPKWMAERLVKYRSKGGQFRKKEDLLKLYNFPKDLYFRLEPYVSIATPSAPQGATAGLGLAEAPLPAPKPQPPKGPTKFDLNTADTTELVKIRGIGSKLAMRILKFRDNLGGFHNETQLREVFGLDSAVVDETLKYAYVRSPQLRNININEVSAETLKHPYLKPYVARAIVAYRQQHGPFGSVKDLANIKVLDAKTLEKIAPYLAF